MRILHTSDTHGKLLPIVHKNIDVIIHSGDFIPDSPMPSHKKDVLSYWQQKWLWDNIDSIKNTIDGRPFLFVGGNHCFFSGAALEASLIEEGINAICLHDRIVEFGGKKLYGFPYVPFINGGHAHELRDELMIEKIKHMSAELKAGIDILVMHCPPQNILDVDFRNGIHYGNPLINEMLFDTLSNEQRPKVVLMGHCHSNNGISIVDNILFSNAATVQHLIEIV